MAHRSGSNLASQFVGSGIKSWIERALCGTSGLAPTRSHPAQCSTRWKPAASLRRAGSPGGGPAPAGRDSWKARSRHFQIGQGRPPEKENSETSTDSPLLDLLDVAVHKMVKQAKIRDFVPYEQINAVLALGRSARRAGAVARHPDGEDTQRRLIESSN
jgi:hypothetical protein